MMSGLRRPAQTTSRQAGARRDRRVVAMIFDWMVLDALGGIVEELGAQLTEPPGVLWVPMGNGTTVAALADAVVAGGWPTRVVGVSSSGNNSVLASWPSTRHRPIPSAAVRDTPPTSRW